MKFPSGLLDTILDQKNESSAKFKVTSSSGWGSSNCQRDTIAPNVINTTFSAVVRYSGRVLHPRTIPRTTNDQEKKAGACQLGQTLKSIMVQSHYNHMKACTDVGLKGSSNCQRDTIAPNVINTTFSAVVRYSGRVLHPRTIPRTTNDQEKKAGACQLCQTLKSIMVQSNYNHMKACMDVGLKGSSNCQRDTIAPNVINTTFSAVVRYSGRVLHPRTIPRTTNDQEKKAGACQLCQTLKSIVVQSNYNHMKACMDVGLKGSSNCQRDTIAPNVINTTFSAVVRYSGRVLHPRTIPRTTNDQEKKAGACQLCQTLKSIMVQSNYNHMKACMDVGLKGSSNCQRDTIAPNVINTTFSAVVRYSGRVLHPRTIPRTTNDQEKKAGACQLGQTLKSIMVQSHYNHMKACMDVGLKGSSNCQRDTIAPNVINTTFSAVVRYSGRVLHPRTIPRTTNDQEKKAGACQLCQTLKSIVVQSNYNHMKACMDVGLKGSSNCQRDTIAPNVINTTFSAVVRYSGRVLHPRTIPRTTNDQEKKAGACQLCQTLKSIMVQSNYNHMKACMDVGLKGSSNCQRDTIAPNVINTTFSAVVRYSGRVLHPRTIPRTTNDREKKAGACQLCQTLKSIVVQSNYNHMKACMDVGLKGSSNCQRDTIAPNVINTTFSAVVRYSGRVLHPRTIPRTTNDQEKKAGACQLCQSQLQHVCVH